MRPTEPKSIYLHVSCVSIEDGYYRDMHTATVHYDDVLGTLQVN